MSDGQRVVLAPDKFKGTLSAAAVAQHLQAGLHRVVPQLDIRLAPVADGGEGTLEAARAAGFSSVAGSVRGPSGDAVVAEIAVRGDTAVVEIAQAAGLQLTTPAARQPLQASSYGVGELVRLALDLGCRTIILGLGGSACTDGGAGMVQALGARLTVAGGRPLAGGGAALRQLDHIDLSGLDPRLPSTTVLVASDVDNPLLGARGAAAVFAPQKGATPAEVPVLEQGLTRWSEVVTATVGDRSSASAPGAGAAGGIAFAALALLGAQLRPGIEVMMEMTRLAELLLGAELVVTGEGSLDEQSLGGKAPIGVARAAARAHVPVFAVAGRTTLSPAELSTAGFAATYTLSELEPDLARCLSEAGPLVERVGERIAREWLLPAPRQATIA